MECDSFLALIRNYRPQDLTQVERIWVVEHYKECVSCRSVICGLPIDNSDDEEICKLAQLDRRIV